MTIEQNEESNGEMRRRLYEKNWRYLEKLRNAGERADIRSYIVSAIFDCVADGLLVFDEEKKIVLANHAVVNMAGYDPENMSRAELHRRYSIFEVDMQSAIPVEREPLEVAFADRSPCELEYYLRNNDGPPKGKWLRANAAPVFGDDGKVVGGVTVISDISERIKLQRQRDAFVALIAHDIKNHLAAERTFYDFLPTLCADGFDAEAGDVLNSLRQRCDFFIDLANSLLELFRCKFFNNPLRETNVSLSEILDLVIGVNEPIAAQRNVTLSLNMADNLAGLHTVPSVLRQVIHNLIMNAIEVTPDNGVVRITAEPGEESVVVTVEDTGPGLTAEECKSLLDPRRVAEHMPRTSRTSSGFGLYLSVVMIEEMGGHFQFESAVGKGTKVFVEIPT